MSHHILVLCSTPEVLKRLRDPLESEGYRVTVVAAEADFEDEVTRDEPDVVILASGLAERKLWEYEGRNMKRVRAGGKAARTGAILLTPWNYHSGSGLAPYREGADMHLSEPFNPKELLTYVRRLIEHPEERVS